MYDKDFKREEIIELAEQIYCYTVKFGYTKDTYTQYAKKAIEMAMVFREAEQEVFKE